MSASEQRCAAPSSAAQASAHVPPELWLEIFAHLPAQDLYQGAGQTSRQWRTLAQTTASCAPMSGLRAPGEQVYDGWGQAAASTRLHHTLRAQPLALGHHQGALCGVALSEDGRQAYTADIRGKVSVFALTLPPALAPAGPLVPQEQLVARAPCLEQLSDMHVLPGAKHMLAASIGGVFVLDLSLSPQAPRMLGRSWMDAAFCVSASADGRTIVTGALEARLQLWRAGHYDSPVLRLKAPTSHASPPAMAYFSNCAMAPDASFVVGLHATGQCFLWRLTEAVPKAFYAGDKPCRSMCLSPDGTVLALSCTDGCLYLRETIAEAPFVPVIKHLCLPEKSASALAFSPDGQRLAVGCVTGEIFVWAWRQTASLGLLLGRHQGPVMSLSWASDQTSLLSGADEIGSARLWAVPARL